jgi:hypothetical protein
MKLSFYLVYVTLCGLLACKTTQNNNPNTTETNTDVSKQSQTNGIWRFEAKEAYKRKENVEIKMYHESETPLKLQHPLEMKLEVEENGTWRTVRRLYCPCLQNCPPPPYDIELSAKERHTFSWKPEEKWCENEEKTAEAPLGKYRLVVTHRKGMEKKMYFQHYVFTLKK